MKYEQIRLDTTTISLDDFDKWEIYGKNNKEIYEIKLKFGDSQMARFHNANLQKSMLTLFFTNLSDNIEALQKEISIFPQNSSIINPDMIR